MNNDVLNDKEQSFLKGISKVISILASIGKFLLYFAIVSLVICMLVIPKFMRNLKAYDDKIVLSYSEEKVTLVKEDDSLVKVYVNDKEQSKIKDVKGFDDLYKLINKHSNKTLIGYSEALILIVILYIYLISLALKHLSKLFKNINKEETPFIEDNVVHLRKMGLYMAAMVIIPPIVSVIFHACTDLKFNFSLDISSAVEALFVIALSYIFKYGCSLQKGSKKTIYNIKE